LGRKYKLTINGGSDGEVVSGGDIKVRTHGQAESVEVCVVSHLSDGLHVSQVILDTWRVIEK